MSLHEELLELDTAIHRLSQGINAVGAMSLGLMQARDPYADGFDAVYGYMVEADREVQKHLNDCLKAI